MPTFNIINTTYSKATLYSHVQYIAKTQCLLCTLELNLHAANEAQHHIIDF